MHFIVHKQILISPNNSEISINYIISVSVYPQREIMQF